jgi:hypothetical protein
LHIDLSALGKLKRYETEVGYEELFYGYKLKNIKIEERSFRVAPSGISLSVSAPKRGIPDVAEFAASIEEVWNGILENLMRILNEATPIIDEAIEEFCESWEGPTPSSSRLLAAGELRYIEIFHDYNQHMIGFTMATFWEAMIFSSA